MGKLFFAFVLLSTIASAAYLTVKEPVSQQLNDFASLDLGVVGPGQKLEVVALRPAGEQSKNTPNKAEALWDAVRIDGLPEGWKAEDSKVYENNMKVFVTLPDNAADGEYAFNLRTLDEYDGLQPLVVKAKVRVSRDMVGMSVQNPEIRAGVSQPAIYYIKIRNPSSASDAFEITAKGLPSQWKYSKQAFVRYNSEEVVPYEVVGAEQGDYNVEITVKSLSSPLITSTGKVKLSTRSSVALDMQAASHGILLFPTVQQTVYSLLALISYFVQ